MCILTILLILPDFCCVCSAFYKYFKNNFALQYWIVNGLCDLSFLQREVLSLQKSIQGSSFDTEYAIKYVETLYKFWLEND